MDGPVRCQVLYCRLTNLYDPFEEEIIVLELHGFETCFERLNEHVVVTGCVLRVGKQVCKNTLKQ
jgi:hypothetical protein